MQKFTSEESRRSEPLKEQVRTLSACTDKESRILVLRDLLEKNQIPYEISQEEQILNILAGNLKSERSLPMICAHYDIFEGSSGANDNLSSVVILLELLKSHKDSFTAAFLDEEESGHGGAKLLLRQIENQNVKKPEAFVVLDTCGYGNTEAYRIRNGRFHPRFRRMTNRQLRKKYHLHSCSSLPESDDAELQKSGAPLMLISMMPSDDVQALEAAANYYGFLRYSSSAFAQVLDSLEVMQTIHNGPYDDPDILFEESMENVLHHLQEILD